MFILKDIETFALGDQTLVGERGLGLSGGQKSRLGLARLVYSPDFFILLDDALASCDSEVANHIFENCIKGLLNDRLVIMVVNQMNFLSKMDKIIVINDEVI